MTMGVSETWNEVNDIVNLVDSRHKSIPIKKINIVPCFGVNFQIVSGDKYRL